MRIWKIFKNPSFCCSAILILLGLFLSKQVLEDNGMGDDKWLVMAVQLLVELVVVLALYKMRRRGAPLEKQFLLLVLVLGILFIAVLPPGQSPDEMNHFRRAYGISQGDFVVTNRVDEAGNVGSSMPSEISEFTTGMPQSGTYEQIMAMLMRGSSGDYSTQAYTNTALYNFICYLPQSLAALLGRVLGMSVVGIAYLMELFNFTVWVLLVYSAIKLIPRFKGFVIFMALLPITLQEATSLSPDALTIGLSFFMVAYVMNLAYGKSKTIGRLDLVLLYVMAGVIGFCKIVYLPLVLLYLIIPEGKFGSKRRKWMHLGVIAGLVLFLNLSWLMVSSGILMEFQPGVNSKEQLLLILSNPFRFMMTIFRTVGANGHWWLTNALGFSLGSFSIHLPDSLFLVSFMMGVLLLSQRNETLELKKYDRLVFVGVFVSVVLLIFTSLYIQWTAVGADVISGIQGRYFLPIMMLVPVMICRTDKKKYPAIISDINVMHYSLFVGMLAIVTIFAQNV